MEYLLLLLVIVFLTAQNMVQKQYNLKTTSPNTFLFGSCSAFCAMIFYLISAKFQLDFNVEFIGYSVGFALCYSTSMIGHFLAIKFGSLSLTVLILSYSLLIPTMYGIIGLNESLSVIGIVGIICLIISLFLIVDKKDKAAFSFKWLLCLTAGFVGNGMCSTVQKMQQLRFDGNYKQEFMMLAMAICAIVLFVISLFNREKYKEGGFFTGFRFGAFNGTANGVVNLLVMILSGMIGNSILFPSVSAGGIVAGFIVATVVYKEKLSRTQLIGYIIGTISIILLNL